MLCVCSGVDRSDLGLAGAIGYTGFGNPFGKSKNMGHKIDASVVNGT